jgi:hypothetical protein
MMILLRRRLLLFESSLSFPSCSNKTLHIVFLVGGFAFVLLSFWHLGFPADEQRRHDHRLNRNPLQPLSQSSRRTLTPSSRLKRIIKNGESETTASWTRSQKWNDANNSTSAGSANSANVSRMDHIADSHNNTVLIQHDLAPKNRLMFPKFKKADDNNDNSNNSSNRQQSPPVLAPTLQSPNGGAFVHMGKTGGSAISLLLRNGCHSWMPHPCRVIPEETTASRLIQSYYHSPDFPFLQQSHHDFYSISIRDPLERFISAFCFEHLQNRLARHEELLRGKNWKYEDLYVCFPTLERYVSYLGGGEGSSHYNTSTDFYYPYKKNQVVVDSCQDLARASFHGHVRPYIHLYFNYERIQSFIPIFFQNATNIYVIRQEHLWDDWKSFNQVLLTKMRQQQNQNNNNQHNDQDTDGMVIVPQQQDHEVVRNLTGAAIHQPVTRDLSPEGYIILCRALDREYQAYFAFLQRAQNLQPRDVQETIQRARRKCPNLRNSSL